MEKVIWFIVGNVLGTAITCLLALGYMQRLKKHFEELLAVKNSADTQNTIVPMKEKVPIDLGGLHGYEKKLGSLDDLVSIFRARGFLVYITKPTETLHSNGDFLDSKLGLHIVAREVQGDVRDFFYSLYKEVIFDETEKEKELSLHPQWVESEFDDAYREKFIKWYIKMPDKYEGFCFSESFKVYDGTETTLTEFSSAYFKNPAFDASRNKTDSLRVSVQLYFHVCTNFEAKLMARYGTEEYPLSVKAE